MTREDMLRELLRREDALAGYAYAVTRDWALAQDAVQEALVAMASAPERFDAVQAGLFGWARGIVRHKAVDLLRARRRLSILPDEDLLDLIERRFEENLDDEAALALARRKEALRQCMERLRRHAIEVLLGFYRDRLSCEDLAARHRRSPNAVRLLLSRTRIWLRECAARHMRRRAEA
jgi:RNA polymerase sigma-70 factor (ECF subfamily)